MFVELSRVLYRSRAHAASMEGNKASDLASDTIATEHMRVATHADESASDPKCQRASNPKCQRIDANGTVCVICLDEEGENPICCSEGHTMHAACMSQYILTEVDALKKTDYIAAKADTAELSGDTATLEALTGNCGCPLRGHGCNAAPFDGRMIARHVSEAAFAAHLEGKSVLAVARKVQQTLQEGSELALMVPNGRMCRRCHFGPVELQNCSDLTAHHGEMRHGNMPVNNACPQCGWFAEDFSRWPLWHPARPAAEEAQWAAAHAAEDEDEGAARRLREATERRRRLAERERERLERRERLRQGRGANGAHPFGPPERAPLERRREGARRMMRLMRLMQHDIREDGDNDGAMDAEMEMDMHIAELDMHRFPGLAEAVGLLPPLPPPPPPPLPPPQPPPAVARLEADLREARAERETYEARVGAAVEARAAAIAAAIEAAPREANADVPPTRVDAPLPPAAPQPSDCTASLALLARLTGFEADSQACEFYLNQGGGDVEGAVRAAVQGARLLTRLE